jgi:NAD-dependent deacetylase
MTPEFQEACRTAARRLAHARRVVCLTGAGVSAESGVATFRDAQSGLWSKFDPRRLASQEGFRENPGMVWRWYMHRLDLVEKVLPNRGHDALTHLERLKSHFVLATQNVDDLHERAGSQHIMHLHGRLNRFHCNVCTLEHELRPDERRDILPPRCPSCGGLIRPSVVWFGEALPARILDRAWREAEKCDLFLVVGTSGVVYPAAQLPLVARQAGATVVDVNPEASELSGIADIYLSGASGVVLPYLVELVEAECRALQFSQN